MASNLPTDLIQQVQITLRTNAGLSSYDPQDPTLPSLPSVDAAITGLNPSPPDLRCKHCKGKLLRELQSVICVYCGKRPKKDVKPDPIAFNSTLAYRWLLKSLHFDGSEVVESSSEKRSEFNRRRNTPKEKKSLSELLDLQITWPDEPEEPETIVTNTSLEKSKSTLNFLADKLDDFFPGSERNNVVNASEEQPAVSNQIAISGNNTFVNPNNLNIFQEVLPSETVIQSTIHASADSFTGWEADFQSADAKNQHEDFKSIEPIVGSAVDLSAHMDSVFGHVDHSNDGKLNSDFAPHPTVSDRIQDDQINNVNSSVLQQAELFDSVIEAKNVVSSDNVNNKSSEIVDNDWFEDTKWQNSNVSSETTNKDDYLFGERNNTSAASPPPPPPPPPPLVNDWIQDDLIFNNIKSSVSEADEQFKFAVNNFSSSDSQQDEQFDLPIGTKSRMSADNANEPSSDSVDWFQDNLWQANSDNAKDKTVKEEVDSFDEWNDFASSAVNQDFSKSSWNQSGNEITASSGQPKPEMDSLISTDQFQEVDFSGFSQSDPFSGSSSNAIEIGEANYIKPEVSTTNRTADATKVGESSEQADVFTEAHRKDDVEMVMSQMHDLSFMFESSLSVPSKPDGVDSFLHD